MANPRITIKDALRYAEIEMGAPVKRVTHFRLEDETGEILFLVYEVMRRGSVDPYVRWKVFEDGKARAGGIWRNG